MMLYLLNWFSGILKLGWKSNFIVTSLRDSIVKLGNLKDFFFPMSIPKLYHNQAENNGINDYL